VVWPVNNRIDIQEALLRARQRWLGLFGALSIGKNLWFHPSGCELLLTWTGELLPIPTLDIRDGTRECGIVGFVAGGQATIDSWSGLAFPNGVHHFAIVGVSPGGSIAEILPHTVVTRVWNGGALLGYLPATPGLVNVRRLSNDAPLVTWCYSRSGEQATPDHFEVYETTPPTPFNFSLPGFVPFAEDQTRYEWIGQPLSVGDVRHYTVRAVSAAGVKSLIPRIDATPSGDYNSVPLERSPRLEIYPGPPGDAGDLYLEALRV
jgi:hypothetical protein